MICGDREGMDDEPITSERREEIIKERILDETFKKAESKREERLENKKKLKKFSYEKTFPRYGYLIILLGVLGLIFINGVPWIYINYNVGYGEINLPIYNDFKESDISYNEVIELFRTPNYIGITTGDLSTTPRLETYASISLILIGIGIIIFGIIDKMRHLSIETFTKIHYIFAAVTIISGSFIAITAMKFLGAHFLLRYNTDLINFDITILTFPAAFILIVLGFIIVKIAFTIIRMDLTILQKKIQDSQEKRFFSYSRGGNI